jgi:hypothetical protein
LTPPITINRAPVLTLWAAVVAERLGFERDEALTLGRAVAGLNAQSKRQHLGMVAASKSGEPPSRRRKSSAHLEHVELLGRSVPVMHTPQGLRAAKDGEADSPAAVKRYLESKFGESFPAAEKAMKSLASSFTPVELAERAFALYESFRPTIPAGVRGWGAKGALDLGKVARLAKKR